MKQEKFNSLMVAIVAISAVFGFVSIVWASFSQTLTISSGATITASNWDIHFENVSGPIATGTASIGTVPTVEGNGTQLTGFSPTLKTPGDSVTFTVDVKNAGTYKAAISSVNLPEITSFVSLAENAADKAAEVAKIDGTRYANSLNPVGTPTPWVTVSLTYNNGNEIAPGDTLNAGDSVKLKMTVTLSSAMPAEDLPADSITVNISDSSIIYGQA